MVKGEIFYKEAMENDDKNKEDVYGTGWDDGCDGKGSDDQAAGGGSEGNGAEGKGWVVSVLSDGGSDGGEGEWGGGVFGGEGKMIIYKSKEFWIVLNSLTVDNLFNTTWVLQKNRVKNAL